MPAVVSFSALAFGFEMCVAVSQYYEPSTQVQASKFMKACMFTGNLLCVAPQLARALLVFSRDVGDTWQRHLGHNSADCEVLERWNHKDFW